MIKYSLDVLFEDEWQNMGLYDKDTPMEEMLQAARSIIEKWYYVDNFLQNVRIIRLDKNIIIWDFQNERENEEKIRKEKEQ